MWVIELYADISRRRKRKDENSFCDEGGGYPEVDAYIHGGRDLGEPLSDVAKHLVEDKVGGYP